MTNTYAFGFVRYLSTARVCEKFSRKRTWLYHQIATDPTFPKSLRLGKFPVWKDHELDDWIKVQAARFIPEVARKRGRPRISKLEYEKQAQRNSTKRNTGQT